ncbi:hypothetical protein U0070_003852 [Myodes glareolus]|uniref:Immunoglobulin V-set domain-containing protein n=1 Tax=Myodes glareolus TaxID=447135 RepID=A0AAW0H5U1_MYOGA
MELLRSNSSAPSITIIGEDEISVASLSISCNPPDSLYRNGVIFLFCSTGASTAQTVTQPQQENFVQEAESATLDCTDDTEDTSNYNLFWYRQQRGRMTLVIHQEAYRQQNMRENHFSMNFQRAAKSFGLEITDSQL